MAISRRPLDLEDYIDVARRHAAWIIAPVFFGLVVATAIAFSLPNVYRSVAVLQITPPQISQDLVKTTSNQLLTDRINQMVGNIKSRTSLSNLIQSPDLNLYLAERAKMPIEDVIEKMQNDLHIDLSNMGSVGNHGSAFQISFSYTNRLKAQQTVSKIINRFVDENQNSLQKTQSMTHDLIGDELAQAKADLEKITQELTKFQSENQGRLPEQSQMNMATLTSLQAQVNGVNDQLNRLSQERVQLEARLETFKSQQDLNSLMAQEASLSVAGSPAMRQNAELENLNKQVDAWESQLAQLRLTFKPDYPDIRNLEKRLKALKTQRDDLQKKQEAELAEEAAKPKESLKKGTNFQVAQNQTTLDGNISATNALLKNNDAEREYRIKEQDKLNKEIEDFRNRLSATSSIAAHYADLQRDQANATQKFQTAQAKQDLTAQNNDLIARKAGESLDVLDPASLPVNPDSPHRGMIVGGGVFVALIFGIALAGVQEAKDTSLKNLKDVRAYTNLPVLCSIPLLENTLLVKRKKRITYVAWAAAVFVGILAICASLFYYLTYTLSA